MPHLYPSSAKDGIHATAIGHRKAPYKDSSELLVLKGATEDGSLYLFHIFA